MCWRCAPSSCSSAQSCWEHSEIQALYDEAEPHLTNTGESDLSGVYFLLVITRKN
jgi:hypothetical protein